MTKKYVYLVDDDEAIRHSASFMLRHAGYTVKTFPDGVSFLDEMTPGASGCVLLDVRMPVMDGLEVQAELSQRGINLPVIVLTGHGDVPVAVEAMKGGALDFLEKPYEKASLISAIEQAFAQLEDCDNAKRAGDEARAKLSALTAREHQVLEFLVAGLTNKRIAQELSISPRTVEIHRSHVMEKLDADSLSAVLRLAFHAGVGHDVPGTLPRDVP